MRGSLCAGVVCSLMAIDGDNPVFKSRFQPFVLLFSFNRTVSRHPYELGNALSSVRSTVSLQVHYMEAAPSVGHHQTLQSHGSRTNVHNLHKKSLQSSWEQHPTETILSPYPPKLPCTSQMSHTINPDNSAPGARSTFP
jgi:hypothetical protein